MISKTGGAFSLNVVKGLDRYKQGDLLNGVKSEFRNQKTEHAFIIEKKAVVQTKLEPGTAVDVQDAELCWVRGKVVSQTGLLVVVDVKGTERKVDLPKVKNCGDMVFNEACPEKKAGAVQIAFQPASVTNTLKGWLVDNGAPAGKKGK